MAELTKQEIQESIDLQIREKKAELERTNKEVIEAIGEEGLKNLDSFTEELALGIKYLVIKNPSAEMLSLIKNFADNIYGQCYPGCMNGKPKRVSDALKVFTEKTNFS